MIERPPRIRTTIKKTVGAGVLSFSALTTPVPATELDTQSLLKHEQALLENPVVAKDTRDMRRAALKFPLEIGSIVLLGYKGDSPDYISAIVIDKRRGGASGIDPVTRDPDKRVESGVRKMAQSGSKYSKILAETRHSHTTHAMQRIIAGRWTPEETEFFGKVGITRDSFKADHAFSLPPSMSDLDVHATVEDDAARKLSQKLSKTLGRPIVIEMRSRVIDAQGSWIYVGCEGDSDCGALPADLSDREIIPLQYGWALRINQLDTIPVDFESMPEYQAIQDGYLKYGFRVRFIPHLKEPPAQAVPR